MAQHASTDVLIAGAGPTGLVLALWLLKQGVRIQIIDVAAEPGTTSRALAVQSRTLELYRQLDLAQAVIAAGHRVPAVNLWVGRSHATRVPLAGLGHGLSAFPFLLIYPQDEHEQLLIARLRDAGVEVQRRTELLDFEDAAGQVRATLRKADGSEELCTAGWLAGCDGARSRVRERLKAGFPGGTYDHLFYVADVEATGRPVDGELHVDLDEADFLGVFPLKDEGRVRLVGSVRDEAAAGGPELKFDDVQGRAMSNLNLEVTRVNWFSTYHVHHRVAEVFRRGRAFLLGDAAHIHSPVGGQGMNTGIGDAINLAWKLAAVIRQGAKQSLLETYEPERIAFARRLVATTDEAFVGVISSGRMAGFLRTKVFPPLIALLFRVPMFRRLAFRTVSQLVVSYRDSPLSSGRAGRVRGGDRLPWVKLPGGTDNFDPLSSLCWQVHVYGEAGADVRELCKRRGLQLACMAWHASFARAGLERNVLYLVRPDGYLGLVDPRPSAGALASYLDRHLGNDVAFSQSSQSQQAAAKS